MFDRARGYQAGQFNDGEVRVNRALHNLALNLGVLAGSLLGPLLSGYLPLRAVLFLTGALRFLGGVLIALRG